ncbi:hypothetical protein N9873_01910 [Akkermansiaceae bacterium]|nr:hypothetical protein [Akkermansiaceae bacterium]MDB4332225.1 hypothetical protein [Akkermansiaceae bacterium]MDB4614976.1 hypothetical protein [Akkermansiaceae bacterium]MDB4667938.1 hypothetical protein [Akkermansiaceae bacterium]
MKILALIAFALASVVQATPLTLKDIKGREIVVEITAYDEDTVTFKKGSKDYTVPWKTFDDASIKKIKSSPLPNPNNKRTEKKVTLQLKDGEPKTLETTTDVYFNEKGILELYPGDVVHLEFEEVEGELINPKVVKEVVNRDRSFTFKFVQNANASILHRSPGLKKTAAVDCSFRDISGDQFESKILFPTEQGRLVVDVFPGTVWTIRVSNIELSDKRAQTVAKERETKQ